MSQETHKKVTVTASSNDLTGQRFGRLVALAPTEERRNGYTVWRCACDCGKEFLAPSRALRNGHRKNCGCVPAHPRYEDLTGRRYGMLIVEERIGSSKGRLLWRCTCDCGGTVVTSTSQLKAGYQKSCGCLSHPPLKDWIGKRFGELTVLSHDGKRHGKHYWNCLCACGKETTVDQTNLQNGHTMSCGCLAQLSKSKRYVEGTCLANICNKGTLNKNNPSGVRGVYPVRKGVWGAQIGFKGKTKYLGRFPTLAEASAARREAESVFDDILKKYAMEPKR